MKKQYLVASFVVSSLLVPVFAHAVTVDEIRAQIQSLLNQIAALQQQLSNLTPGTPSASSTSCPDLYRTLARGSRGSDVTSLQQFLFAQGLLGSDSITGYFGLMTEKAVKQWQAQNSIVQSGVVGAITRAAIAARCGTPAPAPTPNPTACTREYVPVCGQPQCKGTPEQCALMGISAPQTYSNMCTMKADGAYLIHNGACQSIPTGNTCPTDPATGQCLPD